VKIGDRLDEEFARSMFLVEAWDAVAAIEQASARLAAGEAPVDAREALAVVTHRLRASAQLHGALAVAEVADAIERALADLRGAASREDVRAGAARIAGLAEALKARLEADGGGAPEAATASDPLRAELDAFVAANSDVISYFVPEAMEHLETITASVLAIERAGAAAEHLARLFRAVHTLKGAAYVVGCTPVGDVAHRMEDLLVAVREGRATLSPSSIEALLAGADVVRAMLGGGAAGGGELTTVRDAALAALDTQLVSASSAASTRGPDHEPRPRPARTPPPTVTLAAEPNGRPARGIGGRQTIRVGLERLNTLMDLIGEVVVSRSRLDHRVADLERIAAALAASRSRMVRAVGDFERRHLASRLGVGPAPEPAEASGELSVAEIFAELEFDRDDDLSLLARSVGEIASDVAEAQSELTSLARALRDELGQVQRLAGALRGEIGRARLIPIGTLFTRFVRQGQEAARAAGKIVRIETSGEGVELDAGMIEQIVDPLLHLVQNAVAHGIEDVEERRARGKPATGAVTLDACPQSGFVVIEVADDGRGIDTDALRRRAVAQGLLDADGAAALSEEEALDLMFIPGLSTASTVTAASGRGIGMDVVRTNVRRLGGEVEVRTTPGAGARFTLKLPLTVLVSEALVVRAGGEKLALPLGALRQVTTVEIDEIRRVDGVEAVAAEGELVPLFTLAHVLGLPAGARERRVPVLVVRAGAAPFAVAVDEVLHREDIVIKSLGRFLDGVGPFAGATVSAEGRVTLLLDPVRLLEAARSPRPLRAPRPAGPPPEARRVLLVDDSLSVRKFVGQMLERAGLAVTTANDGADALARLGDTSIDVVVTDLEMPRVNGYELIEAVRRRPALRDLPVVVLTTRAGDKHVSLARRLGVRHYVTKPVDEQSFVRLVESLVAGPAVEATA
jgi:chemosensory pili system protein ChpA (sensor histidine kinase/response regulator)